MTDHTLLADILRAECLKRDLVFIDDGRVAVCAVRENGTAYEIGSVCLSLFTSAVRSAAQRAISAVKFCRRFGT